MLYRETAGTPKDACKIACIDHAKGLLAQTQENQPLLRINGIQTQSAQAIDLRNEFHKMQAMGVSYFRVSPSSLDSIELAKQLITEKSLNSKEERDLSCDGYWHGQPGFNNSLAG